MISDAATSYYRMFLLSDTRRNNVAASFTLQHSTEFDTFVAGNLNIAAVIQEDIDQVKIWKCRVHNRIINVDARGSKVRIISSGQPAGKNCQNI